MNKGSHSNYKDLQKAIMGKIDKSFENNVKPYIHHIMRESIESVVYSKYEPRVYKRRREFGGIQDRKNITQKRVDSGKPDGYTYVFTNVTKAKSHPDKLITPLIVLGQNEAKARGIGIYYNNDKEPYTQPRDFILETKRNIQKEYLLHQLKRGVES